MKTRKVSLIKTEAAYGLRMEAQPPLEWLLDFRAAHYQQRLQQRGCKRDPLARAIGLHKHDGLRVCDMTAGVGKDAYWLAHCGAQVTLCEREPLLVECLQRAVELLAQEEQFAAIASRMQVQAGDALDFLDQGFDVAYYDPMFPERKKSALVKKDMQILQALHADEVVSENIIEKVLQHIPKLVVKRPAHAPLLENTQPHHQIEGEKIRFDVYI